MRYYNVVEELVLELNGFLGELVKWKVPKIALVIQSTQYKNNMIWEDHIFKFNELLSKKYDIEMRYILPYSTQQYTPQIVNIAKRQAHRLKGGKKKAQVLEISFGKFSEKDLVRLEDKYGRE